MPKSQRSLSTMPKSYPEICQRFLALRKKSGLPQSDWADKLGLRLSYIKSIETGNHSPNIHAIRKLHEYTGASYNYILDGTDKP